MEVVMRKKTEAGMLWWCTLSKEAISESQLKNPLGVVLHELVIGNHGNLHNTFVQYKSNGT